MTTTTTTSATGTMTAVRLHAHGDAAAAHRALEARATTGKVVLLTGHDW